MNENSWIVLKFSLKFGPNVRINDIPVLVQIMTWRCPGDKPLSEPTVVSLLTHMCVSKITIIGSDNGLQPGRRQAIIWASDEKVIIGPLGINVN